MSAAGPSLTRMRLVGGLWEGFLASSGPKPPSLRVRHADTLVAEPETIPKGDGESWLVRFRVPPEAISDGVQTLVIEDVETGDALAHETIVAGEVFDDDIRAEIGLLRAELDMLKRAFRRHCSESTL